MRFGSLTPCTFAHGARFVRGSGAALTPPSARFEPGPIDSSSPCAFLPCSLCNPLDVRHPRAYVPIPRAGGVGVFFSLSFALAAVKPIKTGESELRLHFPLDAK